MNDLFNDIVKSWPEIRNGMGYIAVGVIAMAWISAAYDWSEDGTSAVPILVPIWPIVLGICALLELFKVVRKLAFKIYK